MKADRIDLGLTGYDELFMSTEERLDAKKPKVDELPLDELKPFKEHPFKVMEDEEMERLKESIRESGVLIPALARPTESGYELISGHRRLTACRALGMSTMPVIVRNLTDEEAIITMVDSNLQREHILPSEKAFAYKMKLEAMKHQGKRTSDQLGQKFSVETNADNSPDSKSQVQRYIRLTNLIPDILKLVDEGRIALTPAVELSYLNSHEQNALYQIMACDELTPSLSQAQRLRKLSEDYTLTDSGISQIMSEIKGNQKEYLKIEVAPLRRYFPPGTTAKQMQTTMLRAMEFYRQHTQNRADKPKEREERYRITKELLWNEIQQARQTQRYNKKRLEDLIYDITDGTDFFIVKVVKLFIALFVALGNARYENYLEELQEANKQLKAQAKKVMQQSNDVSQALKTKDLDNIETVLLEYEKNLSNITLFIHQSVKEGLDIQVRNGVER